MEGLHVVNSMKIQSFRGSYTLNLEKDFSNFINKINSPDVFIIIDENLDLLSLFLLQRTTLNSTKEVFVLANIKEEGDSIEEIYNRTPVPVRSGGSIPIIATFEEKLGIKSVLMGFGLEADAIHSPNENFPLKQFYNGINTIPYFYKYFSEM